MVFARFRHSQGGTGCGSAHKPFRPLAQTILGGPMLQGFKGTYSANLFIVGLAYHFK